MPPTGLKSPLRVFIRTQSGLKHTLEVASPDPSFRYAGATRALGPLCVAPQHLMPHGLMSISYTSHINVELGIPSLQRSLHCFNKCSCIPLRFFHSHPQDRNRQKPAKNKSTGAPVVPALIYKAKWDVYKAQQEKTAWVGPSGTSGPIESKGGPHVVSKGISRSPSASGSCDAGQWRRRQQETGGQGQMLLLRSVWEQQGQLSPFEAADLAYFIALRKNPPERLLHQLIAYLLHSQPERRLSVLRLHRLLRVFQLVPGVAERDVLVPLCAALQRRVSQLKPADLQLLLSDFSAIYTAQFLPFFSAAARVLKQCCQEALEPLPAAQQPEGQQVHEVAETATGGFNNKIKSNSSSHWVKAPNHRKEWLSPLQACFLLHALGRTDFRDSALFCVLLETVDCAVSELVVYRQQRQKQRERLDADAGTPLGERKDPAALLRDAGALPLRGRLSPAAAEITGEALVMCTKGLANLNYTPTRSQLRRLVEVLAPYLLNEEPSVLGHVPSARRLPLLFGAVSGLTRLGAGPVGLRRLIEEACSQPLKSMGPYEPCDLLAAAAALEPVAGLPPHVAAAAVRTLEASLLQGMLPATAVQQLSGLAGEEPEASPAAPAAFTSGVAGCVAVDTDAAGVKGDGVGAFGAGLVSEDDPWASVGDARLSPCSPFWSAAHCYLLAVAVGLAAIRPFIFAMHPAFRVSTLSILASLKALVPPTHRPPSKMIFGTTASVKRQQQHEQQQQQQQQHSEPPESCSFAQTPAVVRVDTSGTATGAPTQHTANCSDSEDQNENVNSEGLREVSERSARPPLHPVIRRLILSVFYRLPCISLRLLVELMEALSVCDFAQREQTEGLSPHDKSRRWHRPLMHALAREGVRKMHQATCDSLVKFLVLFYVELDGYEVSLDPLIYGMQRLAALAPTESLDNTKALRGLLIEMTRRPEGAAAFRSFSPIATQLAEALLRPQLDSKPGQSTCLNGSVKQGQGSPNVCEDAKTARCAPQDEGN